MQTNAIERTVEQFANVKLLGRAPLPPGRKPAAVALRVRELGPTIIAFENQGMSQSQIAGALSLARSSVCAYRSRYLKALRAGLV